MIILRILFQDYIARFGHGSAKLARQAQSKEKVLAKMVASGLTEKVVIDKVRLSCTCVIIFVREQVHVVSSSLSIVSMDF